MIVEPIFTQFIAKKVLNTSDKDLQELLKYLRDSIKDGGVYGQDTPVGNRAEAPEAFRVLEGKVQEGMDYLHEHMGLSTLYYQEIHESWLNFSQNQDISVPHRHPGNFLVAVYYPVSVLGSFLTLLNTDSAADYEMPPGSIVRYTPETSSLHRVPVTGDTLIIMPSWMWHFVENVGREGESIERERFSIVFNARIRPIETIN